MPVSAFGSINQDVVAHVARLPRPGETVIARSVRHLQGGKGANQAIAAARMGAWVRLFGAVGDDAAGRMLLGAIRAAGVDVAGVRTLAARPTGAAYITLSEAGENQIVVVPGANAEACMDEPVGAAVRLAQLETPIAATAAWFGRAGGCRILNTAPALPEAAALFEASDLLILNQTEAAAYLHRADPPRDAHEARAVAQLLTRDGQAAIVTLGAGGAVLVERDAAFHLPALRVPVVDTTGAGDCFCGAIAALIAEGRRPRDALALANAAAGLAVQRAGAGSAMPSRAEAEAYATEYARSIEIGTGALSGS